MGKILMVNFVVIFVCVMVVTQFNNSKDVLGAPFNLPGNHSNRNNQFYHRSIARSLKQDDDPYVPPCHYVYDEATGTEIGETCDGTSENACDPECRCNIQTGKCYAPACHMRQTCSGGRFDHDCIGKCYCSWYVCFTQRDIYQPDEETEE